MRRRDFLKTGVAMAAFSGCAGRKKAPIRSMGLKEKVFEPITIKNITIPNRIVFPAITNRYADDDGYVTPKLINFHKHVAEGGAGLSIVGATPVRKDGKILPNMQMIDDDKYIDGLGQLFESIKQHGSISCIQLFHAGRQTTREVIGTQPVAPSPVPCPGRETPRALSRDEIQELEECFAEGAKRAKTAGADMIELHAAHGYLLNEFLSPYSNKRDEEYGGNTENRTLFLREIIEKIRALVGNDYPVSCRISADEFIEGGLTVEESKVIAHILIDSGVDIISVSVGTCGSKYSGFPTQEQGRRCYAHIARAIKESVDVPVIGVGNILDLADAEKVIQDGDADMAAMGRALIADPYLIEKSASGRTDEINVCIQCRNCMSSLVQSQMSCSVNKNL